MKFTKLLVLSALWLVGLSASAAELIQRTLRPELTADELTALGKTPAVFEEGHYYVLYNAVADKYYRAGNDYQTRASVDATAAVVYFVATDEAKKKGEGVYELKSYVLKFKTFYSSFAGGESDFWTDNDGRADRFWKITPSENGNYRISNVVNATDKFVGFDPAKGDTKLYLLDAAAEGVGVDWTFISAPYNAEKAAEGLKSAIEKAEKAGIDVTKWVEVYNNVDATFAEINAAIAEVKAAITGSLNGASAQTPKDATMLMTNPTFDTIGDFTGWSGTAFGAGGTKWTNAEWYEAAKGADAYQDINDLPAGWYVASVKGFYRAGGAADAYKNYKAQNAASKAIQFYVKIGDQVNEIDVVSPYQGALTEDPANGTASAKDSETGITYYIPNTMKSAGYYMHDKNLYDNILFVKKDADDTALRIGVKKSGDKIGTDWAIFDDFSLTYVGAEESALYPGLAWAKLKIYPDYADSIAHNKVTKTVADEYLAVLNNNEKRAAIADQAGCDAFIAEIAAQKAVVDKNIELWVKYEEQVAEAQKLVNTLKNEGKTSSQEFEDLNDYATGSFPPGEYDEFAVNGSASYILNARAMDNATLEAEIAYLNELMEAVKFLTPDVGEDVTRYLVNADFSKGEEGWKGFRTIKNPDNNMMPVTGGKPNICAEAYYTDGFDLYQEVKGSVSVGVYEISVQGFTRIRRNDGNTYSAAWNQFKETDGKQKMPVYVYFNDNATNMKDVHEEPQLRDFYTDETIAQFIKDGAHTGDIDSLSNGGYYHKIGDKDIADDEVLYFPNTMTGASYAFTKGMYVNSAYGAVVNQGDPIRIGVKGSTNGANWSIYDNFKLTFWGTQADKVLLALQAGIEDVEALNAGTIGKNVVQRIADALAAAKKAAEEQSTDGEAMFATLGELYAAKAAVQTSQELMEKVKAANDSLQDAVSAANMTKLLKNANAFRQDIGTRLNNNDINDDEVEDLLTQIRQWMKDIEKFVELQEWADKLNEATATEEDVANGVVTMDWFLAHETLYSSLEIMLNPESDEEAVKVEQVDSLIEQITMMLDTKYIPANIDTASDAAPVNLTKMLKSPNFTKTTSGKEADQIEGWTVSSGYEGLNAEVLGYYNKKFDMYQEIHGLPEGIYEVRNQAYYRFGWLENDYKFYKRFQQEQKDSSNVFLYAANQTKTDTVYSSAPVKLLASGAREQMLVKKDSTVVEEEIVYTYDTIGTQRPLLEVKDTLKDISGKDSIVYDTLAYVPDNVVAANGYINEKEAERWLNKVVVKLTEGGVLRLGMKQNANVDGDWVIMDNFQLFYYGKNSEKTPDADPSGIVATEQKARVLRTEFFTVGGMRTLAPQQGIVIMRQTLENGNVVVKKVNLK